MKTGIYCGSFSPVHLGHIQIVSEIIRQDLVDQVLIVPTVEYWNKNSLIPLQERIAMLQFFETDRIKVETELNHIPTTYKGMCAYQQLHPEQELTLIVGADNLPKFHEWVDYQLLLRFPFIVIRRDENSEEYIRMRMKELGKENYTVLQIENIDISSTFIRENIDKPELLKDKIDERVYQYILTHNIVF